MQPSTIKPPNCRVSFATSRTIFLSRGRLVALILGNNVAEINSRLVVSSEAPPNVRSVFVNCFKRFVSLRNSPMNVTQYLYVSFTRAIIFQRFARRISSRYSQTPLASWPDARSAKRIFRVALRESFKETRSPQSRLVTGFFRQVNVVAF